MSQYVETRAVPIRELTPFPGNAKRGDVAAIQASLRKNGQYRSLIVRKTDDGELVVLAGNHTMQALAANGNKTARCEILTCDDAEAKRINLADNRLAELGKWDDAALAELLKGVQDDLDGTGYSFDDLDDLLAAADVTDVLPVGPTGARYAETDEEMEERRRRIESYKPRYSEEPAADDDDEDGEEEEYDETEAAQPEDDEDDPVSDRPVSQPAPPAPAGPPYPAPSVSGGAAAITELILVLTVDQKTEVASLVQRIRDRDGELTAGEIVLAALREYAPAEE